MTNIYNIYKYLTDNDTLNIEGIKPSTFYKYLNLYKKAGFKIAKDRKNHKIIRYDKSIKLSDAEIGLVAYLLLLANLFFPKTKYKIFLKLIDKMLKQTDETTENKVFEKFELIKKISIQNFYKEKLELFEKLKEENLLVDVILKNGEKLTLQPDKINFKNRNIFLSFIDEKREIKQININKIVSLNPKMSHSLIKAENKEIIFELYGRLAKIYLLKEGERIIDFSSDRVMVLIFPYSLDAAKSIKELDEVKVQVHTHLGLKEMLSNVISPLDSLNCIVVENNPTIPIVQKRAFVRVVSNMDFKLSKADKFYDCVCINISAGGVAFRLPDSDLAIGDNVVLSFDNLYFEKDIITSAKIIKKEHDCFVAQFIGLNPRDEDKIVKYVFKTIVKNN